MKKLSSWLFSRWKYASLWYENLKKTQARKVKFKIKNWSKLKKHIDNRLLCSSYNKNSTQNTSFSQDNLNVEDYIQEVEQIEG